MSQLNSISATIKTPPHGTIPIIESLSDAYQLWHSFLNQIPRLTRYSLGIKTDNLFTTILELALTAGYAERTNKLAVVKKLSAQFDALKFFLKILWEIKAIDTNKYAQLSQKLEAIGKMIGGWLSSLKKETLPM